MTYWNDPREDNYSFDQAYQWNAAMSNLNGMPVRTYKEPSTLIKLTDNPTPPGPDWSNWDGLLFTAVDGAAKVGMKIHRQNISVSTSRRTIQYSIDGGITWKSFTTSDDSVYFCTLSKGQSVAIKGTSVKYGHYESNAQYYGNSFIFLGKVNARGNVKSLLNNSDTITYDGALAYLFRLAGDSLLTAPYLPYETLPSHAYRAMFYGCSNISRIDTAMTSIQDTSLRYWLSGASDSGDLYCPASLTIPTGASGIPSGWTRHDLPTE